MSHKPDPPEPDTETIAKKYHEKVAEGKIKKNGNGWKKWTSISGLICVFTGILCWPILQPLLLGIEDIPISAAPIVKAHQVEINSLQTEEGTQHDEIIMITNQLENIRQMVKEIRDKERGYSPKQKDLSNHD